MDSTDSLFETLLVMSSPPPRQARVVAARQVETNRRLSPLDNSEVALSI